MQDFFPGCLCSGLTLLPYWEVMEVASCLGHSSGKVTGNSFPFFPLYLVYLTSLRMHRLKFKRGWGQHLPVSQLQQTYQGMPVYLSCLLLV